MKPVLLLLTLLSLDAFVSCKKTFVSTHSLSTLVDTSIYGQWRYYELEGYFGPIYPPSDSVVTLEIGRDGTYFTQLNGQTAAQGDYQLAFNTAYSYTDTTFVFNDFQQTGAFDLSSGIMNLRNDTLYLGDGLFTPEGELISVFVRL